MNQYITVYSLIYTYWEASRPGTPQHNKHATPEICKSRNITQYPKREKMGMITDNRKETNSKKMR